MPVAFRAVVLFVAGEPLVVAEYASEGARAVGPELNAEHYGGRYAKDDRGGDDVGHFFSSFLVRNSHGSSALGLTIVKPRGVEALVSTVSGDETAMFSIVTPLVSVSTTLPETVPWLFPKSLTSL